MSFVVRRERSRFLVLDLGEIAVRARWRYPGLTDRLVVG